MDSISPGGSIISAPWIAGPREGTAAAVVVSFTDFSARSEEDQRGVFETGLRLKESWPVMHGAVGLWLWANPDQLRGGSLSVWEARDDLLRFVRWPVHVAIMREWRDRLSVVSDSWEAERFDADETWARAEVAMRRSPGQPLR